MDNPSLRDVYQLVDILAENLMRESEEIKQEFAAVRQDMCAGFARVDQRFTDVEQDVAGIKQELAEVKQDVAGIKQELAEVKQDVAGIKQELAEVKQDVAGIKQELAEVKQDVAGIKQELAEVKQDVAGVRHDMTVGFASVRKDTADGFRMLQRMDNKLEFFANAVVEQSSDMRMLKRTMTSE